MHGIALLLALGHRTGHRARDTFASQQTVGWEFRATPATHRVMEAPLSARSRELGSCPPAECRPLGHLPGAGGSRAGVNQPRGAAREACNPTTLAPSTSALTWSSGSQAWSGQGLVHGPGSPGLRSYPRPRVWSGTGFRTVHSPTGWL